MPVKLKETHVPLIINYWSNPHQLDGHLKIYVPALIPLQSTTALTNEQFWQMTKISTLIPLCCLLHWCNVCGEHRSVGGCPHVAQHEEIVFGSLSIVTCSHRKNPSIAVNFEPVCWGEGPCFQEETTVIYHH